jgi:membrane carboxypeptidase/penicillin-binding protein
MGKTGSSSGFRDAVFVGSTYGPGGITVAVRVGYDDNRGLGEAETGARVALPIFKEILLEVYRRGLAGPVPAMPPGIESRIGEYIRGRALDRPPTAEVDGLLPEAFPAASPLAVVAIAP